jgi:hypothetical protein
MDLTEEQRAQLQRNKKQAHLQRREATDLADQLQALQAQVCGWQCDNKAQLGCLHAQCLLCAASLAFVLATLFNLYLFFALFLFYYFPPFSASTHT